jgi:hypothetical protein
MCGEYFAGMHIDIEATACLLTLCSDANIHCAGEAVFLRCLPAGPAILSNDSVVPPAVCLYLSAGMPRIG